MIVLCHSEFPATRTINLQLTHECNFNCFYCSDGKYVKNNKYLSIEKIKLFLDNITPDDTEILLIGGEPTLHPDIIEIIKLCESYSYISKVFLVTNGSILKHILNNQFSDKFTISVSYHNSSRISFETYLEIFKNIKSVGINLNIKYIVDGNETVDVIRKKYDIVEQYSKSSTLHPIYHTNYTDEVFNLINDNFINKGRVNTVVYDNGTEEILTEFILSEQKGIFKGMFCDIFKYGVIVSPSGYLYTSCDGDLDKRFNCFLKKDIDRFLESNKNKICTLDYCNCKTKYKKYR